FSRTPQIKRAPRLSCAGLLYVVGVIGSLMMLAVAPTLGRRARPARASPNIQLFRIAAEMYRGGCRACPEKPDSGIWYTQKLAQLTQLITHLPLVTRAEKANLRSMGWAPDP